MNTGLQSAAGSGVGGAVGVLLVVLAPRFGWAPFDDTSAALIVAACSTILSPVFHVLGALLDRLAQPKVTP